ncbi:hypothetical protein VPG91_25565 [Nitrospirillum amazonense]|uniref:hypothetical protein n=1 Tax=Nitrospirillum amazonense TaxID=28077 RepID=UPI002DD41EE1|nr:hypothetical protein [Nitrospirillum amazonense]MEC4594390.1 hypothetical protein [Nitrospirillum amazonense]
MPDSFSSHAPFAASAPGQAMRGWAEAAIPEGRLLIGPTLAVPAGMRRYAITVPFRPWQDNRVIQALNSLDEFGRQRLRLVVDGVDHRCSTGQLMGRVMADFANGSLSAYLIPHATPPISPPTTPPPHSGAYGQPEGDPPGQPAQWSMIQRVVGMLRRSIPHLPRDMQQAARSLFTLETLYWLAGFLAAWAVGHAAGYGEAIDVVLLGVGYAMVGWSVFGGLNDLGHGVAMATTAKTEHDLDEAAKRTAAGLTVLTINALIALIAKVKPASGGKRPPVVEEEPPPPPPDPPDPPVKPVEPVPKAPVYPEKPTAYSVAYEMKLDPSDFGKSRSVQFNRANAALDNALKSDPEFAGQMEELIPGVQKSVSSVGGRATPKDWVWEHASTSTASGQQGVMRLVPDFQHTPGSPWWRVLHPDPGASGGYSEWAIPNGAPKN